MKGIRRYVSISLVLSVALHLYVIGYGKETLEFFWPTPPSQDLKKPLLPDFETPNVSTMPMRVLSEGEYKAIVESRLANKLRADQVKDRAKYLGTQTQRVEKETRAQGFGSAVAEEKRSTQKTPRSLIEDVKSLWKLPVEGNVKEETEAREGLPQKKGSMDLLDRDVAIGADTMLNTDEYIYASFFNRIKQEIGPRWEPKVQQFFRTTLVLGDGVYSTRYAFYLDDDGYLLDIVPLEASGSGTLDSIAAQAIREVGRFPNPPKALKENGRYKVIFGFVAEYSKSRFRPQYIPDPRFGK
jgi:hypothetical protein